MHRDLKPGNLMISGTQYLSQRALIDDVGVVKLADFGLSKSLPKADKHAGYDLDSKFRLTGETGSYRYMAPEVGAREGVGGWWREGGTGRGAAHTLPSPPSSSPLGLPPRALQQQGRRLLLLHDRIPAV